MSLENFFNNANLLSLAIKAFGITFSVIYLVVSIAIYQQIKLMRKTVETTLGQSISALSFFEIILAVFILIWAVFLL